MKMLPQELEKSGLQVKRFYEEQDFKFQLALADAVARGLESTPKCPSLNKISRDGEELLAVTIPPTVGLFNWSGRYPEE
jgi:hypothetical protein